VCVCLGEGKRIFKKGFRGKREKILWAGFSFHGGGYFRG